MISMIFALAAAEVVSPASPKFGYLTAGDLDQRCRSSVTTDVSYCFAYVAAVHDTVRSYEKWLNVTEFCAPGITPQAEIRAAFTSYMQAHPAARDAEAASVVVVALKQHFPCAPAPAPSPAPTKKP